MKIKFFLLTLAATVLPMGLLAQGSVFVANQQKMALLPGRVKNVSFMDGQLFCYTSGVMLKAERSGEQLLGFWADTNYVTLREGVDYVVRNRMTGEVFFTARDKKGRSYLYCCSDQGGKDRKVKQVRMGGGLFNKGMTVEHPTFTSDGKTMFFSSKDAFHHSNGGYDLWFSQYDGKRWTKPENLGARVNTNSDEVTPVVYRDCLLFASNGHAEDNGKLSLYSTRMMSSSENGDTVGEQKVFFCRVQRLPSPMNSDYADDFDLAVDTVANCGYWVSRRLATESDSQLFSFSGALDGVLLWGTVRDKFDHPLRDVTVIARQNEEVVCNTLTDEDGQYHIYLKCDQYYDLAYRRDNYYTTVESINTTKGDEEYLITEARLDVTLDHLPLGQRIFFEDIFGPDVDVELSDRGEELLEPLVRFLNDNPEMKVEMTLVNDLTNNGVFNQMLTDERIQTLENYLYPLLPPTVKIRIANGCLGGDRCCNASGMSRLTVLINR